MFMLLINVIFQSPKHYLENPLIVIFHRMTLFSGYDHEAGGIPVVNNIMFEKDENNPDEQTEQDKDIEDATHHKDSGVYSQPREGKFGVLFQITYQQLHVKHIRAFCFLKLSFSRDR